MRMRCLVFRRHALHKTKKEKMDNKMADKTVTSCATMLIELFRKRRSRNNAQTKLCTCLCHNHQSKKKSLMEVTEMNDNKFFNCKCNHECQENKNGLKDRKRRLKHKKKKIVKFEIEHTGSINSLASPFRTNRPSQTSLDKIQNSPYGKLLTENSCTTSCRSPFHDVNCIHHQRSRTPTYTFDVSPEPRRSITNGFPFTENTRNRTNEIEEDRPKSFYEWAINFKDIELGELESVSQWGSIYRGRWHGDVMVYKKNLSNLSKEELGDFQNEVSMLGLIRHENVVLFMGACTEPPNLAIITSVRKGHTLYTHLHTRQSSFHFSSKLSIAKQVAQGMGYLHAKGFTLGKLCSRNVFLESKVKIGIADYVATSPVVKNDYCCIPKGQLSYYAPELIKSLRKDGIYLSIATKQTQKCDVYAYGTILYELFLGRFPFEGLPPECVIWRLAQGHSEKLDEKEFPLIFKHLVESCWCREPAKRPEFQDVLTTMRKMNIPRSLQKKLSLSDSGAINKEQQFGRFIAQMNSSPLSNMRWKKP